MQNNLAQLLLKVITITEKASNVILPFYQSKQFQFGKKADKTYVTEADTAANDLIVAELSKLSSLPILSEEGDHYSYAIRKNWSSFWLIDPLDGTRGFVNHSQQFTVNIALIENHQPILGVVMVPVSGEIYYAHRDSLAYKKTNSSKAQTIHTKPINWDRVQMLIGKYHNLRRLNSLENALSVIEIIRLNSSMKFVRIAEGLGDFYPRFGPINEWDTAAGHCILRQAGGEVVDFSGNPLQYNAQASLNCPPFIAVGDSSQINKLLDIFAMIRRER